MIGLPGPTLDAATATRVAALAPAGVILFGRNLESPQQTADLLKRVSPLLAGPPLVALDQEGGRVSRLAPWTGETPVAADLARGGHEEARRFGTATARALRSLGFNLDFAPVLDLCAPQTTNGIGDRSFGTDPREVARLAGAFLDGLQQVGVAGCLKHFPGLGDTRVDSHEQLPTVTRSREQLETDLLPFRELAPRAASVMVGHGHYTALDPDAPLPATCSSAAVQGLLRGELGYGGLVVGDDMLMGAVADRDREGKAAVEALRAGCDLLLYCDRLERAERAAQAIVAAAQKDPAFVVRLDAAAGAVRDAASRWPLPTADLAAWNVARDGLAEFRARA
jgi:beta-N-acetylhexosaminidase